MDKPLERRRSPVRLAIVGGVLCAILFAGWRFYGGFVADVSAADLMVSTVERGAIRAQLSASGRVVPTRTELITSPIESRVLTALVTPGTTVTAGDDLMRLDTQQLDLDVQSLADRVALAANTTRTVELDWKEQARKLDSDIAVAEVDLEAAQTRAEKYRQLFETRTVSELDLKAEEVALKRAQIQLDQLRKNRIQLDESMAARVDSARLEEKIRAQELTQLESRRERASLKAPVDGVVLSILDEPGMRVTVGDELVRVADLSRYRIEATLSEFFAERISPGDDATVRVGETTLDGRVSRVRPGVDGGNVVLDIDLDSPSDNVLKPNRRADVRVLAESRDDTLVVDQNGFARGGAEQTAFVVDGDGVAHRRTLQLGVSGIDRVEILSGVAAGERLIVSDTRDYDHLARFRITQP